MYFSPADEDMEDPLHYYLSFKGDFKTVYPPEYAVS